MTNQIMGFLASIGAILGILFLTKRSGIKQGKQEERAISNEETIKDIKRLKEISEANRKLTRNQLISKL